MNDLRSTDRASEGRREGGFYSSISPLTLTLSLGERGLLTIAISFFALHAFLYKDLQDFGVFYQAGARFLEGSALYRLSDGVECFKYSPLVAPLFSAFSLMPFSVASAIWLGLCAGALLFFFAFCSRTYAPALQKPWAHLLALLLISPFLRYLLALGQCDIFLLLALALSESTAKRKPFESGLLLALAVLFKLPFLIFLPLLFVYREWRRILGLTIGLTGGAALSVLRYGFWGAKEQLLEWRALLAQTTPPMLCHFDNQSVFGLACRYVAPPEQKALFMAAALGLGALAVGVSAWAVWRIHRRDKVSSRKLAFALALYLAALLSPLGWRSNLVALLPLFYAGLSRWEELTSRARIALLAMPLANVFVGLVAFDLLGRASFQWLMHQRLLGLFALGSAASCLWTYGANVAHPEPLPEGERHAR